MKFRPTTVVALSIAIALPPITASAETKCGGRTVTIEGTEEADQLVGTPGPDVIAGLEGNDTIMGNEGPDVVCDGTGADIVDGGPGNDAFLQGTGSDAVEGLGNDHCERRKEDRKRFGCERAT